MPKLRRTDQERREKALELAIARAKVQMDLPHDADIAAALGMSHGTYSCRKSRGLYRSFGLDKVSQLARGLRLTGPELCEIIGVPYAKEEESA